MFTSDVHAPFSVNGNARPEFTVEPQLIINATGAWVDQTLQSLKVPGRELLQGTKGTHLFTFAPRLREALHDAAIYGEAPDGRPAFIIPLGGGTLVGTTDDRYSGPPEAAIATEQELDYLITLVNTLVSDVDLTREEVSWHYAGIRPLPKGNSGATSAITRRHFLVENSESVVPMFSIVGGKLTTCRSLAEQAARQVLGRLGLPVVANSQHRPLPGADGYPGSVADLQSGQQQIALETSFSIEQVSAVWQLLGTQTAAVLKEVVNETRGSVTGTNLPKSFVRWVIRQEHVRTLEDLVERRLMLLFESPPRTETLNELAGLLRDAGLLSAESVRAEVEHLTERLREHFGYQLV